MEVEGEGDKSGEKSRPIHGKALQVLGRSLDGFHPLCDGKKLLGTSKQRDKRSNLRL